MRFNYFVIMVFIASALAVVGCSVSDGPSFSSLHRQDYIDEYAVSAESDSVLLIVGEYWYGDDPGQTGVFVSTEPSSDDTIRFRFHVIGETRERNDRAIIDHRWSGDTLRVSCSDHLPWEWEVVEEPSKTQPPTPWLLPERVDIMLPPRVDFRHIGLW